MNSKGRNAWLITWEGPESECNGRCKIVAFLPPQFGERTVRIVLPALFCSEYNYTLCEKLAFGIQNRSSAGFTEWYRHINPAIDYGYVPNDYLRARKVKNLRCEISANDDSESTLYWTEFPKYVDNPDRDPTAPPPNCAADVVKQVIGEIDDHYTYSNRASIEEEKRRRAERNE